MPMPHHDSDWAREVRDRLAEGTVTAYETASRAALGSDPAEALVFANQAVAAAPLRESAHRCRIAAHAAAGNRAEALRAYQDLRRVLAEELGVDPSEESEAAYLGLLVGFLRQNGHKAGEEEKGGEGDAGRSDHGGLRIRVLEN